jgi:hypothetical protein
VSADACCTVTCGGANPDLCRLRANGAWHFEELDGEARLMGVNPAGEVMWRMTGRAPFDQLRFEWHPAAFEAMYRNETYGTFGIVAIMALVLRLLPLGGLVLHGRRRWLTARASSARAFGPGQEHNLAAVPPMRPDGPDG